MTEFYVYEAEYEIAPDGIRSDWTKPVPETVLLHGPFPTEAEATVVAKGRVWASVDKAYHRVAVIRNKGFDPRDPATHDFVYNPDLYWGRKTNPRWDRRGQDPDGV
jgi:hypothetical protein